LMFLIAFSEEFVHMFVGLTFSVRHLNAIRSTANRGCSGIKPLPTLQHM
jgi:hypothetical protein